RRLGLVLRVGIGGDTPPVVDNAAATVLQEGDVDACRLAGHRLVDGVVDDLVDEVVQAVEAGGPDVHPGALPDGFQPLQNGDVLRPVGRCGLGHAGRPFGSNFRSVGRAVERGQFGHKTAGQRPEYHRCKSTREGCHFRRRRTSTRSTTPSPKASRNLPTNSASKYVSWVAQAGSVTATISTPDDRLRGRAWAASWGPTRSAQCPNTSFSEAASGPPRLRATWSSDAFSGRGSGGSSLPIRPPPVCPCE